MMGLTFQDILNIIKEEKGVNEDELQQKVKEKLTRLSGLISDEGAAHIVANEYGVDLLSIIKKKGLKIEKITPGMMGVGVAGKVVRINPVRSFNKNGREGKVGSFLIADETGVLRIVCWDLSHLKYLEDNILKEDTIVKITNGYVRDNNGFTELHLNTKSELSLNPEGVHLENVQRPQAQASSGAYTKKTIGALQQGEFAGVSGTVVQIFEPRFYSACPQCNKKVTDGCPEHGAVTPVNQPILNFIIDDGTGNVRVVAFRDHVGAALGETPENVLKTLHDQPYFETIKNNALGKQFTIVGKVNRNDVVDRLELLANRIEPLDPKALASEILSHM